MLKQARTNIPYKSKRRPRRTNKGPRNTGSAQTRPAAMVRLGAAAVVGSLLLFGLEVSNASAVEPTIPRNPDRAALPIISGPKVVGPESYGSCTVGAVLTPSSWFSRITPYQQATRWIVIAKHCAPMYASIHVGSRTVGNVVWQSATSDIELVRVSPQPENMRAVCVGSSHPETCVLHPRYMPLANNRVFFLSGGRESRMTVSGWEDAPDERFCTSGFATGVRCEFNKFELGPGMYEGPYQHLQAASSSVLDSVAPGDSGGPVLTYSRNLIGVISSGLSGHLARHYGFYYTPMRQVMTELHSYSLGPSEFPAADGESNPLVKADESVDAGWTLAPTEPTTHNSETRPVRMQTTDSSMYFGPAVSQQRTRAER